MARDCSKVLATRRQFVRVSAAATVAGLSSVTSVAESAATSPACPFIERGATVLFQGDSVTDAQRNRDATVPNSQPGFGNGYAWLIASRMLLDRPQDDLKFYNRGVSGNKVYELADRWQSDCLDLKPDVVSILIGVNDFWHIHNWGYGGSLEKYAIDFENLLDKTQLSLPGVRFIICEPFELKLPSGDPKLADEFSGYQAAARALANKFGARFVPFQTKFGAASKIAAPLHWAPDGIHPGPDASALMAHWWLEVIAA